MKIEKLVIILIYIILLTKQVSCPPAKSPAHIIESIIPLFKVLVLLSASYN